MPAGFAAPKTSTQAVSLPMTSRNTLYLGMICFVAALGGLLFGFDTAVISGTIMFLKNQFQLSPGMEGFVVSSGLLGCIIGSLGAGAVSDRFGRKKVLLLSGILLLICSLGCAATQTINGVVAYRFVGGLGVGIASMLSPLYIAEITPPHVRGRMVSFYQFSIALGVLAAYCSNALLLQFVETMRSIATTGFWKLILVDEIWRGMFGAMTLPSVLFFVLLFLVPESPRWLVKRGECARAEKTLAAVVGDEQAKQEVREIHEAIAMEGNSLFQLFEPGLRRALLIGFLLPSFSQISGVNIIIYYATSIFEKLGVGRGSSLGMQAIIGMVCLVFVLVAIWKVDKFGRRPMLLFGTSMITLTLVLLALVVRQGQGGSGLLLFLFCFYVATFSAAFAPIMWVVISEIFPTRIRGRAMSIGTFSMWASCGIVAQTFPWLRDNVGTPGTFLLYACLVAPSVPFVWKMLPETKGKSLEEIERFWHSHARTRPNGD